MDLLFTGDYYARLFNQIAAGSTLTIELITVAVIVALMLLSGYLSAIEVAFFSLTPGDLSDDHMSGTPLRRKIIELRKDPDRLTATIEAADTFINVLILMAGYWLCVAWFGSTMANVWVFIGMIAGWFLLVLVGGEIIPKYYASHHIRTLTMRSAPFMAFMEKLWTPIACQLTAAISFAKRKNSQPALNLSVEELEQALEMTDKNEISEEKNMLEGIIRFGGETAKEIMTPRSDIVDLDIHSSYEEVLRCITENVYSRIPVSDGNIDTIKGVLYIKDLLPHLGKPYNFRWQSLVRPPYFTPETKKIDDLLREFQTNKVHIAMVVDEFGGTSGIVTMEDIIEEIVGEINDEYDEDEKNYVKVAANAYIFEGKTLLTDFYKLLDLDEEVFDKVAGDADTLAGLILELKGEFPTLHEKLKYDHLLFEILEMDQRRIRKIKVTILHTADKGTND